MSTPGGGSAASGRLRAQTFAAFAVVGLPADAVPYVVEALRTELNPEVVAGAARATRGWIGADPDLADALLQGLRNLRGHDAPVDLGAPSTALCEVLAALRVQPSVERGLLEGLWELQAEGAAAWEARVRQAFTETIEVLQRRVGIGIFRLEGEPLQMLAHRHQAGRPATETGRARGRRPAVRRNQLRPGLRPSVPAGGVRPGPAAAL